MRLRRAFTLIEVSAAIAITGMVALISYGTFRAALDTGDRNGQLRERVESAALLEQMLSAAGRHTVETVIAGHPAFELTHVITPSGEPADHLSFSLARNSPPLGATGLWVIDIEARSGWLAVHRRARRWRDVGNACDYAQGNCRTPHAGTGRCSRWEMDGDVDFTAAAPDSVDG